MRPNQLSSLSYSTTGLRFADFTGIHASIVPAVPAVVSLPIANEWRRQIWTVICYFLESNSLSFSVASSRSLARTLMLCSGKMKSWRISVSSGTAISSVVSLFFNIENDYKLLKLYSFFINMKYFYPMEKSLSTFTSISKKREGNWFAVSHHHETVNGRTRSTVPQNVIFARFLSSASMSSHNLRIVASMVALSFWTSCALITNE